MQIRPGFSLLQAIAKLAEPKPVPFAQRLADLAAPGAPTGGTRTAAAVTAQPNKIARDPAELAHHGTTLGTTSLIKPRGSVINVIV